MYTYEGERRAGNKSGHTDTCMDQKVECREYEETQMEEGKKRESTKGACRKRDAHTQEDLCQRGGAAKRDEGGGVRYGRETRTEKERKDVKQSNDEMHFPPGGPSHPRAHSAFTRRETSNETLKTGKRNERTGEGARGRRRRGVRQEGAGVLGGGSSWFVGPRGGARRRSDEEGGFAVAGGPPREVGGRL